jgi:hypothetical protein
MFLCDQQREDTRDIRGHAAVVGICFFSFLLQVKKAKNKGFPKKKQKLEPSIREKIGLKYNYI